MADTEQFCAKMDEWADLMCAKPNNRIGSAPEFASAWRVVRLAIHKSCLLSRTLYGGEKPSQTPCPVHKGVWVGIHHGWPNTFWSGRPIEESPLMRKWYDAGCRCAYHKHCECTTGWQPDEHCGCSASADNEIIG